MTSKLANFFSSGIHGNSWWHLALILAAALALRMVSLEWAEANNYGSQGDSLEACEVAVSYLNGEERAQYIGQPNCNPHSKLPGPLWTIFCAEGLKLSGTAKGIVLLSIVANLAAIALTWWLTLGLFNATAALVASAFMAVSPWAIHDSASIFNPSIMPLFGAVIFLSLAYCFRYPRSRAIWWMPFLVLVGVQFHMSVLGLIVPLVLLAWVSRMQPNWNWLWSGFLAGALTYLPYIQGEIAHHWQNTHGMFFGGSGKFSSSALKVFSSPWSYLINYWSPGWAYAPGEYAKLARETFGSLAALYAVNIFSGWFLLVAAAGVWKIGTDMRRGMVRAPRDAFSRAPGLFMCTATVGIYLLENLVGGKPFHARYCLILLPLLFALFGAGVAHWLQTPRYRNSALLIGSLTLLTSVWFVLGLCRFERERINHGPIFVPGFARLETIYHQLRSHPRATGRIEVRDDDYLKSLPDDDKVLHSAYLIRGYVQLREQQSHSAGTGTTNVTVYVLRAANSSDASNPNVAFVGSGIALAATP